VVGEKVRECSSSSNLSSKHDACGTEFASSRAEERGQHGDVRCVAMSSNAEAYEVDLKQVQGRRCMSDNIIYTFIICIKTISIKS
jgi:hypothetical protein